MSDVSSPTSIEFVPQWAVIGHSWAVKHLSRTLQFGRQRHAYLITGPASIGKTKFAVALAQAVNCTNTQHRPCRVCRTCSLIEAGHHPDVTLLQAEGSSMKIEQIRALQTQLSMRPVEARYRVVILRRFQDATPQAMDALLKTLEEPASSVILILTADTADSLLPTIKSRCQPINLRPLPTALVRKTLEDQYHVKHDQAALLAQLAGGRLGWAIRAASDENMLADRNKWLQLIETALGMNRVQRFGMAETLSKDKPVLFEILDLWQSYIRDALLIAHVTQTPITNRDHHHALEQIARKVKIDDLLKVMKALQRTVRYLEDNANTRLTLEILMLDLPFLTLMPAPP